MEKLGNRLKRLRIESGHSIQEVSAMINIAPSTYREWENGREIRGEPYEKIAKIFGVGLHELLTGQMAISQRTQHFITQLEHDLQNLKRHLESLK